jgi:uncharacterized membrane protein
MNLGAKVSNSISYHVERRQTSFFVAIITGIYDIANDLLPLIGSHGIFR